MTDPADPRRCQGIGAYGQCLLFATEGAKYCPMHGGAKKNVNKENARGYRLTMWQARMEEFAESDKLLSLYQEIGIIKIMIEEILNFCQDANTLILYSTKISNLVMSVEKLVATSKRFEATSGDMLNKQAVLTLAGNLVDIIGKYVKDDTILDEVATAMLTAITDSKTVKETDA